MTIVNLFLAGLVGGLVGATLFVPSVLAFFYVRARVQEWLLDR